MMGPWGGFDHEVQDCSSVTIPYKQAYERTFKKKNVRTDRQLLGLSASHGGAVSDTEHRVIQFHQLLRL